MKMTAEEVAHWAQAVLTGLNVGDVMSGSPLHLKLREVMIAYRADKPEISGNDVADEIEGERATSAVMMSRPTETLKSGYVWHDASESPAGLDCGDRVLVVIEEKERPMSRYSVRRIVILEATETGWDAKDGMYDGYTPEDGIIWALERDILPSK